jgi:hypothetical protein
MVSFYFVDFLELFVNMCLGISFSGVQIPYFFNLWIKSYGCLKFVGEVWARRACARVNQQELTTCAKKKEAMKKIFFFLYMVKLEHPTAFGGQPWPY